jgi:hypothetical protein
MTKKRVDPNGDPYSSKARLWLQENQKDTGNGNEGERVFCDWSAVDPNVLCAAVYGATLAGAAILFGSDRKGFLFSVGVYVGGDKVTKWFHPVKEFDALEDYLKSLAEMGN